MWQKLYIRITCIKIRIYARSALEIRGLNSGVRLPLSKYDKINTLYSTALLIIPDSSWLENKARDFTFQRHLCALLYMYMYRSVSLFLRYHALFIRNHFSLISDKSLELETLYYSFMNAIAPQSLVGNDKIV